MKADVAFFHGTTKDNARSIDKDGWLKESSFFSRDIKYALLYASDKETGSRSIRLIELRSIIENLVVFKVIEKSETYLKMIKIDQTGKTEDGEIFDQDDLEKRHIRLYNRIPRSDIKIVNASKDDKGFVLGKRSYGLIK